MSVNRERLVTRETIVLTPAQLREEIEHPEKVRVKLNDSVLVGPYDIGCFAYSKRVDKAGTWKDFQKPTPVDLVSFRRERVDLLFSLFDYISHGRYRDATRLHALKGFKYVFNFCDSNGLSDFAESRENCRRAYKVLSLELSHQLKLGNITSKMASDRQGNFRRLIRAHYSKDDSAYITERVPRLKSRRGHSKPPTEKHFREYMRVTIRLARRLHQFVEEEENFPFKLKMDGYETFVFHSQGGNTSTPYSNKPNVIYNFVEGRLATFEEWKDSVKGAHPTQYNRSVENLAEVNKNKRHERRIDFATLSMQAYMKIFVLLTGAQPSEVVQLEFDGNIQSEQDILKNDFRAIKLRAAGREVSYNLGDYYGLLLFKEYLKLRKWVLNGAKCKYLFFSTIQSKGNSLQFKQLKQGKSFYRYIYRIRGVYVDKDMADITSCPTRKLKNLILNELNVSMDTRATVLNHTQATNENDYNDTTPDRQASEFQAHWNAIRKARERIDLRGEREKAITTGHCIDEGNPESEFEEPPITPDCKSQYGCVFCNKYSCHADEVDVHKLLSVLGVIEMVRNSSADIEHAEKMFKILSVRIAEILEGIKEKSDEHKLMVERMEKKVMVLGEMTPFWERRLDQYERMGIIISG